MKALSAKHLVVFAILLSGAIAIVSSAQSDVAKVNAIRVENTSTSTRYLIDQTGTADFQDFLLSNPNRLVVDLVGARHALEKTSYEGDGKLVRGVRTSQFRSDPDEVTRIVFDLTEGTKYKVARNGQTVEVSFFADGTSPAAADKKPETMKASFGSAWDPAATETQPKIEQKNESSWVTPKAEMPDPQPLIAAPVTSSSPAAMASAQTDLDEPKAWTGRGTTDAASDLIMRNNATGEMAFAQTGSMMSDKKITLDIQGADIKTVLRSIGEFSGTNIVSGLEVEGAVTVHLVDIPWREALEVILTANGYGMREEYGMIRVGTLDNLHGEELDAMQLEKQKEDLEPMVSRVVKLNYVNAREMKMAMKAVNTKRGTVEAERDNNAVIINDIPRVANRIAEMVVNLDTRIAQVEIVAKMVDVDVEVIRELGVQWGALNLMSADVNAVGDALIGKPLTDPFGQFRIGTVQSWGDLMLSVEALERENKANIISNPRITTTDNREATILVGKEIPLIVADEAGNAITELKKIGVTLRCTPHVNSDLTVTLDLHPEISELSSQATVQGGVIISLQESDTRVVVRDGETAVIGGLIQEVETHISNGLPVLKDVPLLGGLFRFENKTNKKRELIIFVTPRIVGEIAEASEDLSY
jgi:type IV pilus secretin PilQ/predicted competence protein